MKMSSSISLVLFISVFTLTQHFGGCNVLRKTMSDAIIEKRSVDAPNSGITLNFAQGMHDFIVNGQGVTAVQGKTVVAFQASLTSGQIGPNYADGAIKFNDVGLNVGNGYDPNSGKFTAPVGGIYQFTATCLQQNGYSSHVRLMKEATVISDLHSNHKNYDQLTKTILVSLEKGKTFWVKLEKSSLYAVHGSGLYTQFGGFLLSVTDE